MQKEAGEDPDKELKTESQQPCCTGEDLNRSQEVHELAFVTASNFFFSPGSEMYREMWFSLTHPEGETLVITSEHDPTLLLILDV